MAASSPNLHALIIGIDDYSFPRTGFWPLKSAVADANNFRDWVVNELGVSPSRIRNLRNEGATRQAIIKGLQDLATKATIKQGDPILIYYAGHGSEASAPAEWHWDSPKIQMIIPWDHKPADVHGIPDRTLGQLLTDIADKKGDNITVVFDSCHSGSGTRSGDGDSRTRGGYYTGEIPAGLDKDLFSNSGTRGARVAARFRHHGLRSHVLLAACAQDEEAKEENTSGDFTRVLLKALTGVPTTEITYEDLMQRMEKLTKQTPQCEGFFRSRILFNKRVPNTKAIYDVVLGAGRVTIGAGAIHGVELETKFGLWKSRADIQSKPYATLTVNSSSTIRAYETDIPTSAVAGPMVAQMLGNPKSRLPIYVPPNIKDLDCYKTVFSTEGGRVLPPVTVVDKEALATIGLKYFEGNDPAIGFEMLNPQEAKQKIRHVVGPTADELQQAMSHLAAYYHHKDRKNPNPPIITDNSGRNGELFSSKFTLDVFILENKEGNTSKKMLVPKGPSKNIDGSGVKITVCEETRQDNYGFCIKNHTDIDVFPYLFYFDSSNFSISLISQPEVVGQSDEKHIAPLKKKSSLTIGYGSSVVTGTAQNLYIWDEANFEMGYFRLYLSTKYVDLSFMVQKEISESTRGSRPAPVSSDPSPFWDSITVPVVLERGPWVAPKHMIGIIGSKWNRKHTFLAELSKSLDQSQAPALEPFFQNAYVKEYSITVPGCQTFSLVELPGFEDPGKVDNHIAALRATLSYLTKEYQEGRRFISFIWCYNISTYLSEVDSLNLKLVVDLCGEEMFKNIVVLTTNWNKVAMVKLKGPTSRGSVVGAVPSLEKYENSEQQMMEDPRVWKPLKDGDARFERFGVFRDSANRKRNPATAGVKDPLDLLKSMLNNAPGALQAQKEASTTRIVTETTVGKTLSTRIEEKIKKKADDIQKLEKELKTMNEDHKYWADVQREKKDAAEDIVRWKQMLKEIGRVNSVFM